MKLVGNDYLLQKVLSQGPCGVFWRALDQTRGQLVGVRFLPESFRINTDAMNRFRRQFAAVQAFRHPNVVTPERFVEDQTDGAFWVVRLVEGPLLDEYVLQWTQAEGQFPPHLVFDILRQVASTLDEAQQRKLCHRRLSPHSIVVHPTEGVRILDFELIGIVRESLEPALFVGGEELSRFLAPEQIDGRGASPYTDQYALGVIAYELFGGRHRGLDAVLLPLLDQPEYINQALQRAMNRDPMARFSSCREFIDALENVKPSQDVTLQDVAEAPEPPSLGTLTPFEVIATAASEAKATSVTKKIHRERRFKRLFDLWTVILLIVIVIVAVWNRKGLFQRITRPPNNQATEDSPQHPDDVDKRGAARPSKQNSPYARITSAPREPEFNGPEVPQFQDGKIPIIVVPDEVRFAGTSGTGKRIVFVIDASAAMGNGKQAPLSHARKELEYSFNNLNATQRFQVVYFNEEANVLTNDDDDPMIPVSPSNLKQAYKFLAAIKGSGRGDPFVALCKAISLNPDLIFFLSDENAVQLRTDQIDQIREHSGGVPIHGVEIGNGMVSDEPTPIKTLATACRGQFQWISASLHSLDRFTRP